MRTGQTVGVSPGVSPGDLLRACLLGLVGGALVGFTAALLRPQRRSRA